MSDGSRNRSSGSMTRIVLILLLGAGLFFGRDHLDRINTALNPNSPPPASTAARSDTNTQDCCLDLTTPQRRTHILTGDGSGGGHKCGVKKPGKSEFPCDWSDDEVIHAISVIARDHGGQCRVQGNGNCVIDRPHRGETVRVVLGRDKQFIITGYPLNRPRNPQ